MKQEKLAYIEFLSEMDLNSNKKFCQNNDSFSITNPIKQKFFKIKKIPKNHSSNRYYTPNYVDVGVQTEDTIFNYFSFERNFFNFFNHFPSPINIFRNLNIQSNFMLKNQLNIYTTNSNNGNSSHENGENSKNVKNKKDPSSQLEIQKYQSNISTIDPSKPKQLNIFGSSFNFSASGNILKTNILEDLTNNKNSISINCNNNCLCNQVNNVNSKLINFKQIQQMQTNAFIPLYNNDVLTPKMPPFFSNPFQIIPQNINKKHIFLRKKIFIKKIKEIDNEKFIIIGDKRSKSDFSETLNSETDKINLLPKPADSNKGRKKKMFEGMGKHTKFSTDNMMRKIKNKVLEYCRSLINRILNDDLAEYNYDKSKIASTLPSPVTSNCLCITDLISNPPINEDGKIQEIGLRKIKGLISQELNVKFNFWFYLLKVKEIFSFDLSGKYTIANRNSNNELIKFIFNEKNSNYFKKSKQLLEMPFHQFYHDIFLNEDKMWKNRFGIPENNINYQIDRLLISLEKDEKENYYEKMNKLAHEYEEFFLSKRPRNSFDIIGMEKKKIHVFIRDYLSQKYNEFYDKIKELKKFYDERNLTKEGDILRTDDVE